jgi:hypothetical protein
VPISTGGGDPGRRRWRAGPSDPIEATMGERQCEDGGDGGARRFGAPLGDGSARIEGTQGRRWTLGPAEPRWDRMGVARGERGRPRGK